MVILFLYLQLNVDNVYHSRDINVEPAWIQGINGSGITVAIVDNGKCQVYYNII